MKIPEKIDKVIIFGNSQIAELAQVYLFYDSPYEIIGFTVDKKWINKPKFHNLPVVPFEEVKKHYPPDQFKMFLPISYRNVNKLRAQKYYEAKEKGYELISYICSKATIWPGLEVGDNCFIFEDNVIQPFAKIGNNVILWSGNHVGHHTVIKDHCFIASHVVISGSVTIEPYCFFGVNSTIRDNITIAKECVIGAGAIISKDTREKGVYYGPSANILKKSGLSEDLKQI